MAKYTFSMESDDLHEVVQFLNTFAAKAVPTAKSPTDTPTGETALRGHTAEEAASPDKPARASRKREAPAPVEAAQEPADEPVAEEHPMLKAPTLIELKEKANSMIMADASKGPKLIAALKDRFSVQGFGAVAAADYPRCMAMLEELDG
jgi:hypothetical protein